MGEKGLGIGLGALFGDAAIESEPNDFEYLPISKVEPRKNQPRDIFSEDGLQELSESILEHGIIQPLTVRKLSDGFYQIIAGERRWRAARIAGLQEVPARIIDADDLKATELALVENLQRQDLNPVEEAKGYHALISEYGLTQEAVSQSVSKSRSTVANSLRLLSLPDTILEMLERGKISLGIARTLLSLEGDRNRINAAQTVINNKLTVRQTELLVKKLRKEQSTSKKLQAVGLVVNYLEEVERRLTTSLGRKVKIVDGKKKGRFEIEYYNREDFELLLDALESLEEKGDNEK